MPFFTGERVIPTSKECQPDSDIFLEHQARYKFVAPLVSGRKVLDLACGTGYGSKIIAEAGAMEVWGGDIDNELIEENKENYQNYKIFFRKMDVADIPFPDNYFDVLVSFETVEHIKECEKFMGEASRVLKNDGLFIMSTPNKKATLKLDIQNPFHVREFDKEELAAALANRFNKIEFFGQRPIADLRPHQKYLKKIYFLYRSLKKLDFLKKYFPLAWREKIGHEISGIDNNYQIEKISENKEYLYFIAVCGK
jgi:ubiquinone/menaquinone biosynthesis C-methylase UbiE